MNKNRSVEEIEEAIRKTVSKKPENERLEYLTHYSALQQVVAETESANRDFWLKEHSRILELLKKANKKIRSSKPNKRNKLDPDYLSYPDEDEYR